MPDCWLWYKLTQVWIKRCCRLPSVTFHTSWFQIKITRGQTAWRACVCAYKCFHGEDHTDFLWRRVRRHIHTPSRSDNCFSQRFVTLPLVWTLLNQSQNYFSGTWRRETTSLLPLTASSDEARGLSSRLASLLHCNQQSTTRCAITAHIAQPSNWNTSILQQQKGGKQ